jgi:hypothetical protein
MIEALKHAVVLFASSVINKSYVENRAIIEGALRLADDTAALHRQAAVNDHGYSFPLA